MITVDASAILAILLDEPEGPTFKELLLRAGKAVISPVNYWEVMVRFRATHGLEGLPLAEALFKQCGVEVRSLTPEHGRLAVQAHERYGRATPAKLNLGDCFAYALAATEGDGLLFKGGDFPKTDVKVATG